VNTDYKDRLEAAGLKFTGMYLEGQLPEMVELEGHPWFLGMQFHPEFKSRPFDPHPVFKAFIEAALKRAKEIQH
jgi:CTP synthase